MRITRQRIGIRRGPPRIVVAVDGSAGAEAALAAGAGREAPEQILICGGCANISGVSDVISSRVGISAEKGDPLGQMKLSSRAKAQAVASVVNGVGMWLLRSGRFAPWQYYAMVVVDVRGTGASFGTRDSFRSPREVEHWLRGPLADVAQAGCQPGLR